LIHGEFNELKAHFELVSIHFSIVDVLEPQNSLKNHFKIETLLTQGCTKVDDDFILLAKSHDPIPKIKNEFVIVKFNLLAQS
jgi:hypothetical protein